MAHGIIDFTYTQKPGNSGFVIPIDSTRGLVESTGGPILAGSAFLAPGSFRYKWPRRIVTWTIKAATQNVTLDEQVLSGIAGTSSDWETQGAAGTHTITAGTTATGEFKPLSPDWRILITAGATGPSACIIKITSTFSSDYGN